MADLANYGILKHLEACDWLCVMAPWEFSCSARREFHAQHAPRLDKTVGEGRQQIRLAEDVMPI